MSGGEHHRTLNDEGGVATALAEAHLEVGLELQRWLTGRWRRGSGGDQPLPIFAGLSGLHFVPALPKGAKSVTLRVVECKTERLVLAIPKSWEPGKEA